MSVNIGNTYTSGTQAYQKTQSAKTTDTAETAATTTGTETAAVKEDTFVKSQSYTPDLDKVKAMKTDLTKNISAFKMMVQGMFQKQGGIASDAMNALLKIDKATQDAAIEAISEDGEWGVEQTSARILNFAQALSGGDPSKISMLKQAVEDGFKAAAKIWGGELPEISQKTYDKVMLGFQEWEDSSTAAKA